MLEPGQDAPDFETEDHLGNRVSLRELRGKNVVLWFYPKADTPGWTKEGCGFRDLASDFEKKNTVIYGVSFDTPEENRAFAEKFSFNFPLLSDTNREMGLAYGACTDASAGAARRIGVVIGPDGKVLRYDPKVDAATYPKIVLAGLPG